MARGKAKRARKRSGPIKGTLLAVLGGLLAGVAIMAIHVLVIARLWPDTSLAIYSAFSLLWLSTLAGAGVAVWTLRRNAINRRAVTIPVVFLTALALAVASAILGLVPPAGAADWIAGALDSSTPLSASVDALDPSTAPFLGDRLAGDEIWYALGLEFLLVMALVYAIIRLGLRRDLCRSCRAAMTFHKGAFHWLASDLVAARERIESRDWSYFRQPSALEGQGSALRFDLSTCPDCGANNALDVVIEQRTGTSSRLVGKLTLSRDDVRTIQSLDR